MKRVSLAMLAVCIVVAWAVAADPKENRESLEQAFAAKLTGATLVGAFSVDGKDGGSKNADRYKIVSAKKSNGDDWVVTATMKLGEKEIDIPIPIKIYWAGDTPVMSLTELTIPGMGTFTARVMFYGNRYAGSWQHGDVGGHMWGVVERPVEKPAP